MELKIGDIIKNRREELELTQDELCEGLCDRRTISRIETNRSIPSVFIMENIMQRLAIPIKENYYLLLNSDINIHYLQQQIIMYCSKWEFEKAKELLFQLETISDKSSSVQQQFILSKKAVIENLDDNDKIEMLTKAIKLTLPKFNINNIKYKALTLEECKIIINLANIYSKTDREKAITIYYQLLNITKLSFVNVEDYDLINSMIACCLSQNLYNAKRYYEAITIADIGIQNRIKYGRPNLLGELMSNKAYCLLKLKNKMEGEQLLKEAITFMKVMKSIDNYIITIQEAKNIFNIDLSDL
ncbi:helix-turn-helix domain-containing protein [Paraclostridium bifermentans]|uniref:helix-turn-helix domain-containing protein n=1 Tax=Paraclostridium bifermentans TaxID=1490 RepID=UPI0024303F67|nr:helix-turn-helix transcriptional regulator [Paraclostridium bifermentans]